MSSELHADDEAVSGAAVDRSNPRGERSRPNVAGDLPTIFQAAPMFRRALAGYDRFEVESYVQWAEDELATADREREHLLARQLETAAGLDQARELLAHSARGSQFLQTSRRIGSLLATAADEAEAMRAEAEAVRAEAAAGRRSAADEAERALAEAREREAAMTAAAERVLTGARDEAAAMVEQARCIVAATEETRTRTQAEAAARLAGIRDHEQRAAEQADRIREQAVAEAVAARLQARDEVVALLTTGRQERQRADVEAAALRERLAREAAAARTALLSDVAALEERRTALRAEVERPTGGLAGTDSDSRRRHPRSLLARLHWRPRSALVRHRVRLPGR